MPLFWKPYKSDISKLIDELKAKNPMLEAEQLAARSLHWDKPVDRDAQADYNESRVPQPGHIQRTRR